MTTTTGLAVSDHHSSVPVFYDATRRRWIGFLVLSGGALSVVAVMLSVLSLAITERPTINSVHLQSPTVAVASISPSLLAEPTGVGVAAPAELAATRPVLAEPQMAEPVIAAVEPVSLLAEPIAVVAAVALPRPRPDHAPRSTAVTKPPVLDVPPTPSFSYLGAQVAKGPLQPRTGSSFVTLPLPKARQETGFLSGVDEVLSAIGALLVPPVQAQEFIASGPEPEVQAYFVSWDDASTSSLGEHFHKIDVLIPQWLALKDAEGNLTIDAGQVTGQTLELLAEYEHLSVRPMLSNFADGEWQVDWLRTIYRSPERTKALVRETVDYLVRHEFDGLTLRFNGLTAADWPAHARFLATLRNELQKHGLLLQHSVQMAHSGMDAVALAGLVDVVIVEAYGGTISTDAPGPLAAQEWFETNMADWIAAVPAEKLVVSLVNQALDWGATGSAETLSVLDALTRAKQAKAEVALDPVALNTHFSYQAADGSAHVVWMLDAVSAFNQIRAVASHGLRGVALNRLGTEDASLWDVISSPGFSDLSALATVDFSYQIARNGKGEVIRLVAVPKIGSRSLRVEGDRVTAAAFDVLPQAYEIDHWGADEPGYVALTFDDGPDPLYTPQVLDILARYGVPATFFTVGSHMMRHPHLVERMIAEGHEVGSHTYSHVNISTMSPEMLRLDLNATQRVFESITGRNMAMFRAPYSVDANPRTPAEIAPLATVGSLGYITVNMNVDPKDWWLPHADRIARDTIRGVENGDGNVVLLHDAGGAREATIEALPRIIEELQERGFKFVGVSELIGLTADEVMPVSATHQGLWARLQDAGFTFLREGEKVLAGLFFVAIGLGIGRALILIVLSSVRRPHPRSTTDLGAYRVGVVVPAYNEEKVILKTVRSLLKSDYRNFQILVVDDGSKDGTYRLCRDAFAHDPRVEVITKPNGGKAAALNYGIQLLDVDVVIALDADTVFLPDTITKLVSHFHDERVVAVAGNAKVGNRLNLLTRWQAVEYITAQNLDRRAFDLLNCITVVPGAVGAWWRDTVIELGGFSTDTLAEDADLTIRILRAGYRVTYDEDAIALTEAPEGTRLLFRQRFRWMFGMLQVARKHAGALKLRDSRSFALVAMPNLVLFQIIFPLVAPVADLVAILTLMTLGMQMLIGANLIGGGEAFLFLGLFFAFTLLDLLAAIIAFSHERREDWRLLIWLLPQRFYYRQLLYLVAIKAAITAIRGSMVGWGAQKRSANVRVVNGSVKPIS